MILRAREYLTFWCSIRLLIRAILETFIKLMNHTRILFMLKKNYHNEKVNITKEEKFVEWSNVYH